MQNLKPYDFALNGSQSCSYSISLGQKQERKSLNRTAIIKSHWICFLALSTQNKEFSRPFAYFKEESLIITSSMGEMARYSLSKRPQIETQ